MVRKPLKPLRFPTSGYEVVHQNVLLEEEKFDDFKKGIYYRVNIGDVFASKYQVVGKLGFGVTSTVWPRARPPVRRVCTFESRGR